MTTKIRVSGARKLPRINYNKLKQIIYWQYGLQKIVELRARNETLMIVKSQAKGQLIMKYTELHCIPGGVYEECINNYHGDTIEITMIHNDGIRDCHEVFVDSRPSFKNISCRHWDIGCSGRGSAIQCNAHKGDPQTGPKGNNGAFSIYD